MKNLFCKEFWPGMEQPKVNLPVLLNMSKEAKYYLFKTLFNFSHQSQATVSFAPNRYFAYTGSDPVFGVG